jgi:hypothetical protein
LKVVGDSPEMCRALDAYGFADFKRFIARMRALKSVYEISDPRYPYSSLGNYGTLLDHGTELYSHHSMLKKKIFDSQFS